MSGYNTDTEYVGVIAQELQNIAPYMIGTLQKNREEYLTVDASAMTYMLINAVQELNQEKVEMNAALDHQQKQITTLHKEIEALKKQTLTILNSMEKLRATDD